MAWIFEFTIRCPNEGVAKALAEKYAGQVFTFAVAHGMWGGDVCKFATGASLVEGEWWASIVARAVTTTGISSCEEASRANQFCNVMYGMLRNERFFEYALSGVECGEFRTLGELKQELVSNEAKKWDGLVVSKDLLAEYGDPAYFVEFSETHRWIPKRPEHYPR